MQKNTYSKFKKQCESFSEGTLIKNIKIFDSSEYLDVNNDVEFNVISIKNDFFKFSFISMEWAAKLKDDKDIDDFVGINRLIILRELSFSNIINALEKYLTIFYESDNYHKKNNKDYEKVRL